jgi:transmembrane sensor
LVLTAGIYFYKHRQEPVEMVHTEQEIDIAPGSNQAVLTLSDGRKILLKEAGEGKLAEQSGIHITKAADGQLVYTVSDVAEASASTAYNTIETPLGGQYQVNLPDGSRVWLNSGSSLRYPVKFGSRERRVEISGEVYFEVAHDPAKPFRVVSKEQVVEVLGTHFNIMAYPDEQSVKTTLVDGSVKVSQAGKSKLIRPGQQASMGKNGSFEVKEVDTDEVTAWKDGFFVFKSEDLGSIMRQISRWYDVDVEYQGNITGKIFGGKISRTKNVSEVLQILELTESIHFKIVPGDEQGEGRRIIVMP